MQYFPFLYAITLWCITSLVLYRNLETILKSVERLKRSQAWCEGLSCLHGVQEQMAWAWIFYIILSLKCTYSILYTVFRIIFLKYRFGKLHLQLKSFIEIFCEKCVVARLEAHIGFIIIYLLWRPGIRNIKRKKSLMIVKMFIIFWNKLSWELTNVFSSMQPMNENSVIFI